MLRHVLPIAALFCLFTLRATAQPAPTLPRVTAGAPISRPPLLGEIGVALQNGSLHGSLVYTSDQPDSAATSGRGFLAFYSNLSATEGAAKVVVYPLQISGTNVPFDPQFAPDGQTILFKVGTIDGAYHLFALDLKSGAVRLAVKRELSLRRVLFSPDGQYLAYIAGQMDDEAQPLRLLVNEWKKDREKLIVRNNGTFNGFAWSAPHTLYFTALPSAPKAHPGADHKDEVKALPAVANQKLPTVARPNIYVTTPESSDIQLAMLEGNRPQPSPDAKWVAFFGMETPTNPWPLRDNWQRSPYYVALSMMRAEGLGRVAINEETKTYPALFWKEDNRHLVAASFVPVTPPERRREVSQPILKSSLEVRTWDTEDGHFDRNAHLEAAALGVVPNAEGDFFANALGLTRDNKTLLLLAQSAPRDSKFLAESALPGGPTVLTALTLASVQPQALATISRSTGLDWRQPRPTP